MSPSLVLQAEEDQEVCDGENRGRGAEEMALQLRALVALAEDPGSIQHPHGGSQPYITPVSGIQCPVLISANTRHVHVVHRHTCNTNTHAHKIQINVKTNKIIVELRRERQVVALFSSQS